MTKPISKESSEHYAWGEQCGGWHLLKSAELSVIQECVPPGAGEVEHFHRQAQQFFFVLSGQASLTVGDACHRLSPGQGYHVPAGTPHQLSNEGSEALEFLVVSAPMAHGDRVVVEPGAQQATGADREDAAAFGEYLKNEKTLIFDGTEQRVQRPSNQEAQKAHCSGKATQ